MPLFLHHPLITKPGGEKLSKASRDTGVREMRAAGMRAEDVVDAAR
jgi:glutamyl/glutaminyl-tRNA synthetase